MKTIKIGYCPICDETMDFETEELSASCYFCGHHLALKPLVETEENQESKQNNDY